ncbi:MAG: hypothetical protein LBG72_07195, partial [Spirochaetaceae bacterium]|nr:hypothetical protein [Spirochaetaceae bacterium]
AKQDGAALDEINSELITKGLELGFLDLLKNEYTNIIHILKERFEYDASTRKYYITRPFTTHLDVRVRIQYYVESFLRRMELENTPPSFDKIVLHIMPLLKNGVTPERQTILSVLEDIADKTGTDGWRLKREDRGLFE